MEPAQIATQQVSEQQTQPLSIPRPVGHNNIKEPRLEGAILEVCRAAVAICLPMLTIPALLIGIVCYYRVNTVSKLPIVLLAPGDIHDDAAYYINFSPTRLATISSWASSVTSFISTSVLVLISFPLARHYLKHSNACSLDQLPSPYSTLR